jgi:uncharacterized RDD family membrane protein YckC
MRCPRCGFVQSAAHATCRYCGTKLSQAAPPSAQAQPRANDRADARSAGSVVIPFPGARAQGPASGQRAPEPSGGSPASSDDRPGPPEWKEQLRERVRAIRERRGGEVTEPARKVSETESVSPSARRSDSGPAQEHTAPVETVATRTRREPRHPSEHAGTYPDPVPDSRRESSEPPLRDHEHALPAKEAEKHLLRRELTDLDQETESVEEDIGEVLRTQSDMADWSERGEYSRDFLIARGALEESAEQIAPASLARRVGAALIDIGVILFSAIPFIASVELVYGDFSHRAVRLALVGTVGAIGVLYETILLSVAGRTVGMAAAGLLALNAQTMNLPSAGQAVRHILGSLLGAIPLFFGFLWALFNRERRTFADIFSGIVVKRVAASVYESQEIHAPWLYRSAPERRR